MIDAGLFDRFPVEAIYAVHNWPGLPLGTIAARVGPMMAAVDNFELRFTGTGAHAAMPHLGDDPVLAAAAFVGSVQRIVSRSVDPQTPLVVSITQIHGGNVGNVVPGEVWLQGTCRFFDPSLSQLCERLIGEIAGGIAAAHGVVGGLDYKRGYPPVINTAEAVACAVKAAKSVVGHAQVRTEFAPSMGCEDFAYMIQAASGAYAWIGAGEAGPGQGLMAIVTTSMTPLCRSCWSIGSSWSRNPCPHRRRKAPVEHGRHAQAGRDGAADAALVMSDGLPGPSGFPEPQACCCYQT